MRRWALCGCCAALLVGAPRLPGQSTDNARQIFDLTNTDRREQGLPALEWNEALAAAAQAHAERMAREGALSHQYAGEPPLMQRAEQAGAHFEAIAENVAMAPDAEGVEQAWMHSTPHRTNILDPKMNALGIGVVERGGALYAVEDFAEASRALSPQQVEQSVQEMLKELGIDPSLPAMQAEQACAMQHGVPPGPTPRLMVRYQTPDLQQLQAQLRQQVHPGTYAKAAVGACAPIGVQGAFTMYRVAVLLY
jgi:Cysteine-rich secretory protein family